VPATETAGELATLLREGGVDAGLAAKLAEYGSLLLEANARVNLTGATDAGALVPHLLDALTLRPFVGDAHTLVDVGSGGGLPGIPLALATGIDVLLLEPIAKKTAFLTDALRTLGLSGEARAERAEVAARADARERFDLATARAVSSAPTVAELTIPFLRIGGRALLQRGAIDARERQALDDAVLILGARVIDEVVVGDERRILVLEKIAATGNRFPRRNGVPEKRPLCL
jgi:16S rRNA (guanine527-N7)-methyltransferase